MTPADLVRDRQCSPGCLAATSSPARCVCPRCHGVWHGVLANADITAMAEARRAGRDRLDDSQVVADAVA